MIPIQYTQHSSPLGLLTLASTDNGICGIYFPDQRNFRGTTEWQENHQQVHFKKVKQQLDAYFAGDLQQFNVPLDLTVYGTPFQQSVWEKLLTIRFGQTSTYGQHAQQINKPRAVRAVGGAIGRNPISIIVPCHRVIGSNGALTGYDGGLERKKYLLKLEGFIKSD